jgi:hypothetical protein
MTAPHPKLPHRWEPKEIAVLLRLCVILNARDVETTYEYGETERREPQFYILSADLAQDCVSCISRISKDGRPWYLIEDGWGSLLAEGASLDALVSSPNRLLELLRGYALTATTFIGGLLSWDPTKESVEFVLSSLAVY